MWAKSEAKAARATYAGRWRVVVGWCGVLPFLVERASAPQARAGGGWSGEVGQDDRQAGTADNRTLLRKGG